MINITSIENKIYNDGSHFSYIIIEPLNLGHGISVGNSLRRTLLSDISGSAIKGVRINNVKSEFTEVVGVKEDTLEILLNLKEIVVKQNFHGNLRKSIITGFLQIQGPIVVTAGMFKLPKDKIQILNPNQYICSILTPTELFIEIDIDRGKGYSLINYSNRYIRRKKFNNEKGSTLLMDAIFNPIKVINYKTKLVYDSKGNIKEALHFEMLTNGALTPYRALLEASKILLNVFISLLAYSNLLKLNININQIIKEDIFTENIITQF
jgi:DNA-directed RNA polymerase subunit alpha